MAAGTLRERVRFETRGTGSADDFGNVSEDWATVLTVWGQIKPSRGNEEVLATKLQGVSPVEIRVRWSSNLANLTASDRAVNDRTGAIYNIRSVENPDMRRKYLTIYAEAGVAT